MGRVFSLSQNFMLGRGAVTELDWFSLGMGRPMPGHARAVVGGLGDLD